jgi:hypothetical protein
MNSAQQQAKKQEILAEVLLRLIIESFYCFLATTGLLGAFFNVRTCPKEAD